MVLFFNVLWVPMFAKNKNKKVQEPLNTGSGNMGDKIIGFNISF